MNGYEPPARSGTRRALAFAILLLAGGVAACGPPRPASPAAPAPEALSVEWSEIDSLRARLPDRISVFEGRSSNPPLRAWYVVIGGVSSTVPVSIALAGDRETRRETVTGFAERLGACVAVNGGYFTLNRVPAVSYGLFVVDGVVRGAATDTVIRDASVYNVARAAIGITPAGKPEIAWATSRGDTVLAWDAPPENSPGTPAPAPERMHGRHWRVDQALGAGPMLVEGGRPRITVDGEGFFGTTIPDRHPRTAAGLSSDGKLILMVVDGRQEASIGVTLEELAQLMIEAGAERALNLDGGGSSAMVVADVLVNQPQGVRGQTVERPVKNAVAAFCPEDDAR